MPTHTTTIKYLNIIECEIPSHPCAHLYLTLVPARGFTSPELQRNVPCNGVIGGLKEVHWRLDGEEVPGGGRRGELSLSISSKQSQF